MRAVGVHSQGASRARPRFGDMRKPRAVVDDTRLSRGERMPDVVTVRDVHRLPADPIRGPRMLRKRRVRPGVDAVVGLQEPLDEMATGKAGGARDERKTGRDGAHGRRLPYWAS